MPAPQYRSGTARNRHSFAVSFITFQTSFHHRQFFQSCTITRGKVVVKEITLVIPNPHKRRIHKWWSLMIVYNSTFLNIGNNTVRNGPRLFLLLWPRNQKFLLDQRNTGQSRPERWTNKALSKRRRKRWVMFFCLQNQCAWESGALGQHQTSSQKVHKMGVQAQITPICPKGGHFLI